MTKQFLVHGSRAQPSPADGDTAAPLSPVVPVQSTPHGVTFRMCSPAEPPPRLVSTGASGSPAPLQGALTRHSAAEQQPVRSCRAPAAVARHCPTLPRLVHVPCVCQCDWDQIIVTRVIDVRYVGTSTVIACAQ